MKGEGNRMKSRIQCALLATALIVLVGCSTTPTPEAVVTSEPTATQFSPALAASQVTATVPEPSLLPTLPGAQPTSSASISSPAPSPAQDPFALVSQSSLFAFLTDLTSIQPYSGWRNSASQGEAEALDYVAGKLGGLQYLAQAGLTLERQSFHVFLGTELWETRLFLTSGGPEVEVPADGLRGPRDNLTQALRFDSDGALNDSARNPVTVAGPVLVVRSAAVADDLSPAEVQGRVVMLDYACVDRVLVDPSRISTIVSDVLAGRPAGVVLITTDSDELGQSHGSFVGDLSPFDSAENEPMVPVLYARLEDLTPAGVGNWEGLANVESARLVWDADVSSPANSGNLVARIPGADTGHAVILSAHIDSPNGPGALDDGSGSAILMEVARVLDEAHVRPPTDLYLVWFGSEELGLYGSSYFVATHQELLDRTLAILQTDMLSRPLGGLAAELKLVTWSYRFHGNARPTWPDYLTQVAASHGVQTVPEDLPYVYSDNNSFGGFDVPHADLIFEPDEAGTGSVHYVSRIHDPYDTVDQAREVSDTFEQMARVVLAAALDTGRDLPSLRVTPAADRRAVFVASHTEPVHMTPSSMTEVGMTLAMAGMDVDLIPYGQTVALADIEDADLVVVLPVADYPSPDGDVGLYDEVWQPAEMDALQAYVAGGGLLVLTNSAHRLKYGNQVLDTNEDWSDVNPLGERFGVTFQDGTVPGSQAVTEGASPLVADVTSLELGLNNGVPFDLAGSSASQVLAQAKGQPVAALVDYGKSSGQVLVLADVGMLNGNWGMPHNLTFWQNLARYTGSR
jgi:hypothetical protein